jgi:hypothetical protein
MQPYSDLDKLYLLLFLFCLCVGQYTEIKNYLIRSRDCTSVRAQTNQTRETKLFIDKQTST